MTPLESEHVPANLSPHGANQASLLTLDHENVTISTWKRAGDGNGKILCLPEIAGENVTTHAGSRPLRVAVAEQCSLAEECAEKIPVAEHGLLLTLRPFGILTIRLKTRPTGEL